MAWTGITLYLIDFIQVCACTVDEKQGGCARPNDGITSPCASAQAQTDINPTADKLVGKINITVDGSTYNITWNPPSRPNAVILRYEVEVR